MEEENVKEKKYRISNVLGGMMFLTALLYDAIEFLLDWLGVGLVINPLIAIFAGLHFWLWFRLHDVGFMDNPKRFATKTIQDIVEFIPGLDALVVASLGHTIGILILLILVRIEDKTGVSIPLPSAKKAPTLETARTATLKEGNANLRRAREIGRESERPTMESSRQQTLSAMKNLSKRRPVDMRKRDVSS